MSAVQPNIIVVLGMHRSGTSTIARSLKVLGVDLGDDLFPPLEDNPLGFWEDNRCLQLNETLLRYLGSAYDLFLLRDDLARLVDGDDRLQPLFAQAVDLLRERSRRYGIWGFKDPRTARLLPFWQRAIERAGCIAGYVIAVRNPLSIAESLAARNGIARAKSHLLWLQHVVPALCETADSPRVVVDYDRMLEDAGRELGRIAGALGLDAPAQHPAELSDFVDGFLAGELRHTLFSVDDLGRNPEVPGDVAALYRLASAMARDEGPTDASELSDTLAAFQHRLSAGNPVLAYIGSLEEQNTDLQRIAGDRQSRIEALTEELSSYPDDDSVRDGVALYPGPNRSSSRETEENLLRLGELQARCASAEIDRDKARQHAARADEESARLRVRSEEIAEQRTKLERSQTVLQRKWRQETARRTALEAQLAPLQAGCEREREYNSELLQRIDDLSAELGHQRESQRERELADEQWIAALRDELAVAGRDREALREELASTSRDRDVLREGFAWAERDRGLLSEKLAVADRDREALREELASTSRDRDVLRESFAWAERDRGLLSEKLAVADRDREALREKLASAARDHDALCEELASAGRNNDALRDELDSTRRDRDALREAYGAQEQSLRQLRDEAAASADRLRAEALHNEQMSRELVRAHEQVAVLLHSLSWRLTGPLRFLRRNLVTRPRVFAMREASQAARRLWWSLPLDMTARQALKGTIFRALPTLLGRTEAYRNWRRINGSGTVISNPATETTAKAAEYVPRQNRLPPANKPARLICFYLPQFHPIPENDAWWGEGFTEWTNVKPARPQFVGHYQPHVPDELGYYDLLDGETQRCQVELAKQYGIEGFCFYFYWFAGTRLLETPIQNYLADASLDLPFCLCWANENWSRRWDGLDDALLIAQDHSAEDDLAFIEHVARYMRDRRYIRIDGRPLLLVYRPGLLPSPSETAQRWREWCRANGLGEIYLAYTQSFEVVDPADYGFDAALEFPPNNSGPPDVTDTVEPVEDDFASIVYDWQIFVERSEDYRSPGYRLFRGVCPAWDNTPRRKNEGTVFLNSNPADYQQWLENAIEYTAREFPDPEERLIFVNAWNEWAEGAHLEPDRRYGYAWLEATRRALDAVSGRDDDRKIVVVSHDAHPHGAQYLALNMVRTLVQDFGFAVDVVLLDDGELAGEFRRMATVHSLAGDDDAGERAVALAERLAACGHQAALVNTTVSGRFLGALAGAGLRCVALIHELPGIIAAYGLEQHAATIARQAERIVFPATCVEEAFSQVTGSRADTFSVRPQGLYKRNRYRNDTARARGELRELLALEGSARIVLGVGYADHRKGVDLFVETGLEVMQRDANVHFIWLGHWEQDMQALVEGRLKGEDDAGRFHFPGRTDDTDLFYAGADLFALTSREDPFPSVVMESLEVSVPVVAFRGAGGSEELIGAGAGVMVAMEDHRAMAQAVSSLLDDDERRRAMGAYGAQRIEAEYSFRHYLFDLLDYAGIGLKRVSAVVPNYNYAHYLRQRLDSVFSQSYPLYEVIVMDDASTDDSVAVIAECLADVAIDHRLLCNDENSGSVFRQWERGAAAARGDYLWMCEADDYAEPDFVTEVVSLMDDGVVMGYSQSAQVDEDGNILVGDYLDYTDDVHTEKWLTDHICEGTEELARSMSVKNTIPNVSAVIFRRDELQNCLEVVRSELNRLRIAGDWLVYAELLRHGRIAFAAKTLNYHRRHSNSVTLGSDNERHMAEILYMQDRVRASIKVDSAVIARARDYAMSVYQYLGLDQGYAKSPSTQPGVERYLAMMCEYEDAEPHTVTG